LDFKSKSLLVEAFIYLGLARILVFIPFARVAPLLGETMKETPETNEKINHKQIKKVRHSIEIVSKYTFWESKCLVRAIAGMKMLKRRKIESTLYLGTTKDEYGKMIAHAWLRSDTLFVTGAEGKDIFTVVGKFANHNVGKECRGIKC
jgi:hypothetical protein